MTTNAERKALRAERAARREARGFQAEAAKLDQAALLGRKPNDGGPAFPTDVMEGGIPWTNPGMSLRDYFAAQAMQGMQARDAYDAGQATPQQRAALAYLEADAMLAARSQSENPL